MHLLSTGVDLRPTYMWSTLQGQQFASLENHLCYSWWSNAVWIQGNWHIISALDHIWWSAVSLSALCVCRMCDRNIAALSLLTGHSTSLQDRVLKRLMYVLTDFNVCTYWLADFCWLKFTHLLSFVLYIIFIYCDTESIIFYYSKVLYVLCCTVQHWYGLLSAVHSFICLVISSIWS